MQAYALHRDTLEPVEDETLPDMERMSKRLQDRSQEFLDSVYEEVMFRM
jgi:hypothetical protein